MCCDDVCEMWTLHLHRIASHMHAILSGSGDHHLLGDQQCDFCAVEEFKNRKNDHALTGSLRANDALAQALLTE